MPRSPDPALRTQLLQHAADLLAAREPVSLRRLASATGTSTMAVYTHFGGMPGLWEAVRREGFSRLGSRLDGLRPTGDPVGDVTRVGAAYVTNALVNPSLYLLMFENRQGVANPDSGQAGLDALVQAVDRARRHGRFAESTPPVSAATQLWALTHGVVALVLTAALPPDALVTELPAMVTAAYVGFGDDPVAARASVELGWQAMAHEVSAFLAAAPS